MGKRTAEEIRKDASKLQEYKLEFLFRNKEFVKLMNDTREHPKSLLHHYDIYPNTIRLLKALKIPYDDRYLDWLRDDYLLHLHKKGVIKKLPEHMARQKEYSWPIFMPSVKAVLKPRYISTVNFEKITGFKLKRKSYHKRYTPSLRKQVQIDYLNKILPIIVKNYEKLQWEEFEDLEYLTSEGYYLRAWEPVIYSNDTNSFFSVMNSTAFETIWEFTLLEDHGFLTVKINITTTKTQLIGQLKDLIDRCKGLVSDEGRRGQLNLYGDYLKVFDLVETKGKRWTEIAKEVFPEDVDPEGARIKAEQYYERACKLVEEGLP